MTTRRRVLTCCTSLLLVAGCHKSTDVTDTSGPPQVTRDQTLPECASGAGPGSHGPASRHVGRLDGSCFWVDESEVTVAQYAELLATAPGDAANVAECRGANADFAPSTAAPFDGALPVVGVDWCDAAAFCAWAGKRLCGTYAVAATTQSEYVSTCEDGGNQGFNWGDLVAHDTCQGGGRTGAARVKAKTGCVTPTLVYDLVGNVREWTSECHGAGASAPCEARGGSFASVSSDWGCDSSRALARTSTRDDMGFRCCAD